MISNDTTPPPPFLLVSLKFGVCVCVCVEKKNNKFGLPSEAKSSSVSQSFASGKRRFVLYKAEQMFFLPPSLRTLYYTCSFGVPKEKNIAFWLVANFFDWELKN